MKKVLSLSIALILAFSTFFSTTNTSYADNNQPSISAKYAVLMDYETGQVLYNKNGSQKLYPASTTKAWTAYLVIKHVPDLNKVIKIENAPVVEGSSMYLKNGESFTIKELLDALLIHSSNDVSIVLANYVSGSIEKFAELMNKEAKAIGAKNTHFNNPHGLPDLNHYTTAYDMALMAREAMSNAIFRNIVKSTYVKFAPTEFYPEERYFPNTNKFLNSTEKINYRGQEIDIKYDIIDGIKTGYTDDAGRCLLSSAMKDNMRLISAVFKSDGNNLYLDSRTLIDYGFENFYSSTIINKAEFTNTKKVLFTKQGKLVYEPAYTFKQVLLNNTNNNEYTTKEKLDKIKLPIKKGDKVGSLEVYEGKSLVKSIDLVAKGNVNSIFSFITENKLFTGTVKIILSLVALFVILIVTLIIRKKIRRKKRKNARQNNRNRKNHKNIYSLDDRRRKRRK